MDDNNQAPALPYPVAVLATCIAVGLLLTLCDRYSHVQFGAVSYPDAVFNRQAWWVWPNFIGAALGMYFGAKLLFGRRLQRPAAATFLGNLVLFIAVYFITGIFSGTPGPLLAGLLVAWAVRIALCRERTMLVIWSLVLALIGCLIEGASSAAGMFHYARPEIFHVPYWLAALYMHGSFVVLDLVGTIERRYHRVS